MKIGMLLPSLLAAKRFEDRIFAPKVLFLSLVDGLVKKGHQVFVYTASDVETCGKLISGDALLEKSDFPSVRLRLSEEELTEKMSFKLTYNEYELDLTVKALLHAKSQKLDIIHSYHDFSVHYLSKLIPEIPVVYTLHDPPYAPNTLEGWRFNHFPNDYYIAISHSQEKGFSPRVKIFDIIYHGLTLENFPYCGESEDYFAFIGRFIPEKGAEVAVTAADKLKFRLHMATSGNYLSTPYYLNTLKPLIEKTSNVEVVGYLKEEERNNWLKKAKALLLPILWDEPFGMVMIEAMACGVPVIAFNRGSVSEIITDGETGFIVEPAEGIEGIIEAVRKLNALSQDEYKKMRENCRRRVGEKFTTEKMVSRYEGVYKKILDIK